jgi:hypothetical protein
VPKLMERRAPMSLAVWLWWTLAASLAGCGRLLYGPADAGPADARGGLDSAFAVSPDPDAALPDTRLAGDAPACRSSEVCDLVLPQCGCGGEEGCFLSDDGSLSCEPAAGAVAPIGTRCSGPRSCEPGSTCVGRGGTLICAQLCEDDSDCGAGVCARDLFVRMGTVRSPYRTCSAGCDPLGLDRTCAAGLRCMLAMLGGRTVADCNGPIGAGAEGAACTGNTDCAEGHVCLARLCRFLCDVAAPSCPAGSTCSPRTALVSDVGSYGVCE